jgi:putative endonuclease
MFAVYILKLEGKKNHYVGVSQNFKRRVLEHKRGNVKSTKGRFLCVLHTEEFENKKEAWAREKWLKSGKGREWVRSLTG